MSGSIQQPYDLPVPVEKARSLLGEKGKPLTDEEVVRLIRQLDELAVLLISMYMVQNKGKV